MKNRIYLRGNRLLCFSFVIISFIFSVKAISNPYCAPTLEAKAGYFVFSDSKMRKIYDRGGLDVQLSGSYPIRKYFQAYGSIEYMHRRGHSQGENRATTCIRKFPVTLGIKTLINICRSVDYYITLAPRYVFVHVHNDSPYVDRNLHQSGFGGLLGTGLTFRYRDCFLSVFGEYSYEKVRFHSKKHNVYGKNIQIGGFVVGMGLGYAF